MLICFAKLFTMYIHIRSMMFNSKKSDHNYIYTHRYTYTVCNIMYIMNVTSRALEGRCIVGNT